MASGPSPCCPYTDSFLRVAAEGAGQRAAGARVAREAAATPGGSRPDCDRALAGAVRVYRPRKSLKAAVTCSLYLRARRAASARPQTRSRATASAAVSLLRCACARPRRTALLTTGGRPRHARPLRPRPRPRPPGAGAAPQASPCRVRGHDTDRVPRHGPRVRVEFDKSKVVLGRGQRGGRKGGGRCGRGQRRSRSLCACCW